MGNFCAGRLWTLPILPIRNRWASCTANRSAVFRTCLAGLVLSAGFSSTAESACAISQEGSAGTRVAGKAETIHVSPVTIRLIRECDVPARDSGILADVQLREGRKVVTGDLVAAMESRQQELGVELARLGFESAKEEASNDLAVLAAEDGLKEAELRLATLEVSLRVARTIAENSAAVDIARTDEGSASVQLERARAAKERNSSSVSDAEMTRLTAQLRKAELAVEEASSRMATAQLQVSQQEAALAEQRAAISRHRHLADQERRKLSQAARIADTRGVELELAQSILQRRSVISPIDGVVARVYRQPGEFVEAGTPILRVIQLHSLRAEGFVDVALADPALNGRPVRIQVTGIGRTPQSFDGVVTWVGQEVEPLNQQVRIWAEFDSPRLSVYPGMTAEMMILPPSDMERR